MNARALCLLLLLAAPLSASPWDRDRPGDNFLPNVADACTGRFDVFPAGYYEARARALKGLLQNAPPLAEATLLMRDDMAVALLRLGRYAQAIVEIDLKLQALEADSAADPRMIANHLDRARKNKAVCLLARWQESAAPEDLAAALELVRSAEQAARHVPENWFLVRELEYFQRRPAGTDAVLPNLLGVKEETFRDARKPGALASKNLSGAIEQLVRRVTCGGQSESPDLFYALSLACSLEGRNQDAALAWLRTCELLDAGKRLTCRHELAGDALRKALSSHLDDPKGPAQVAEWKVGFTKLKAEAAVWRQQRLQYLEAALQRGEHPDFTPDFWGKPAAQIAPAPAANAPSDQDPKPLVGTAMFIGGGAAVLFLFLVVGGLAIYFARRHPPGPNVDEL